MTKYKVLGEKYGVTITRPWNAEMYKHNDTVREKMISNITNGLKKAYEAKDFDKLNIFSRALEGSIYGDSYRMSEMYRHLSQTAENAASWLLNQEYGYLVHFELVEPVDVELIGF